MNALVDQMPEGHQLTKSASTAETLRSATLKALGETTWANPRAALASSESRSTAVLTTFSTGAFATQSTGRI